MQEIPQLTFKQPLSHSLTHSHLADENLDMVTLHCRRDHLSPSFHENTSSSCYKSSYSPAKGSTNYNSPDVEKGLSRFRKYQNSTGMLPGIPKISEGSQYQKSYHGHSQEKPQKSKEKQSFFLKYNWALDPTSNYQKDYLVKNPSQINKDNGQRVNHNNLTVFKLKQKPFNSSNYRSNFKAFTIKKEAELCLGAVKDHLQGNGMDIGAQSRISEYQRRYDSVMELTKNKENKLSLYGRNVISRKPKNL